MEFLKIRKKIEKKIRSQEESNPGVQNPETENTVCLGMYMY